MGVTGGGNQLRWVLDVVFSEDQSRARNKNAGENLATLRRWSLYLIKADKLRAKRSLKGRRKCGGWDNAYLLHLLGIRCDA